MAIWLSGSGIVLVLIGAWFVAYEVVAKFRGPTHGVSVSYGGAGPVNKLGTFIAWEKKRNAAMWFGLGCITLGSFLQLAGLLVQSCR
jgi:hypothetical protein